MKADRLSEIDRINGKSYDSVAFLERVNTDLGAARVSILRFTINGDEDEKTTFANAVGKLNGDLGALRTIFTADAPDLLPVLEEYRIVVEGYTSKVLAEQIRLASSPETHAKAVATVTPMRNNAPGSARDRAAAALNAKVLAWSQDWTERAKAELQETRALAIGSGIVCALIGIAMAWLITRSTARPIAAMTKAMQALASGDHAVTVPAIGQRDEVGAMAGAVEVFRGAAIDKLALERRAAETRETAEQARAHQERERQVAADQQAAVLDGLAASLRQLAGGDLACQLRGSVPAGIRAAARRLQPGGRFSWRR